MSGENINSASPSVSRGAAFAIKTNDPPANSGSRASPSSDSPLVDDKLTDGKNYFSFFSKVKKGFNVFITIGRRLREVYNSSRTPQEQKRDYINFYEKTAGFICFFLFFHYLDSVEDSNREDVLTEVVKAVVGAVRNCIPNKLLKR